MAAEFKCVLDPLTLRTRHSFGLSRGSASEFHNLVVRIEADGIAGLGEVAPSAYYGETSELARMSLPRYWQVALPRIPELLECPDPTGLLLEIHADWDRVLRRNGAARCGLDSALWDLWGKARGVSLAGFWTSGSLNCPPSSLTIAIGAPETLPGRIREAAAHEVLKVKLGGPDDLATLRAIREACTARIRVDANCAWWGPEAVQRLQPMVDLGLELIEQPCPPPDRDGLALVRSAFGVPVFADESAETLEDLEVLRGRVDGINVKLVKSGGPTRALRAIRRARELGFQVMLGCMIESSLGITAAAHLAPLVDFIDLDGALLVREDPFHGVDWQDGRPRLPRGPGLGVVPRNS